jgi:hypothetical protein
VAAATEGELKGMHLTKLKMVAAFAAVCLALIGSGCLRQANKPLEAQANGKEQSKAKLDTQASGKAESTAKLDTQANGKVESTAKLDTQAKEEPKAKPGASGAGDTTKAISKEEFEWLYKLIKPLPGEYAWRDEIPWLTRFQAAREKAVAEDKPIFIMASNNAFPLGRT